MKDFDSLKNLWQQMPDESVSADVPAVLKKTADTKTILLRQQLLRCMILAATAVFIGWMAFFNQEHVSLITTTIAVVLMLAVILAQSGICLNTYQKIKQIDDAMDPVNHLQQWKSYYMFRKAQVKRINPMYYLILNIAFVLYFIEILGRLSMQWVVIALGIYTGWVLFAWFVLGKRSLVKEENRLNTIISNLEELASQLQNK